MTIISICARKTRPKYGHWARPPSGGLLLLRHVLWRPDSETSLAAVASTQQECAAGWQGYLCNFNNTFGFSGGNYEVPIILLVTSALLLVIIWELIAHHRKKLVKVGKAPPWENMPQ